MTERDGLRNLHVRESRHDRVGFVGSQMHQHFLELTD